MKGIKAHTRHKSSNSVLYLSFPPPLRVAACDGGECQGSTRSVQVASSGLGNAVHSLGAWLALRLPNILQAFENALPRFRDSMPSDSIALAGHMRLCVGRGVRIRFARKVDGQQLTFRAIHGFTGFLSLHEACRLAPAPVWVSFA